MGRPRVHDAETRRSLIRAAERLLQEGGPDAVTVRAVAGAAGTSVQAIYSVLGSKDGLVQALHAESFRTLLRAVQAVPVTDDPLGDLVRLGTDAFRPYALGHPSLFRLAFERLASDVDAGTDAEQSATEAFAHLASRVHRAGVRPHRVPDAALQFHALCQGMASSELQGFLVRATGDPAMLWEEALTALVTGLVNDVTRRAAGLPGGTGSPATAARGR